MPIYVNRKEYTFMGMSASQARLLSITSRLTNNEFRAQTITNSKLRLATEQQEASNTYMDALNSKELMFMSYNQEGFAEKVKLTPAVLYDYAPMKNQYMLKNQADKFLISNADAKNFENTKNLFEFLTCYNLTYDMTDAVNDKRHDDWEKKCEELKKKYEKEHAEWEEIMKNWNSGSQNTTLYEKFVSIVGDSRKLNQGPQTYCYYRGLDGHASCYLHLLNHLIGWYDDKPHRVPCTTTTGKSLTTNGSTGGMDPVGSVNSKLFQEISEGIEDPKVTADGSDKFTPYYKNDGVDDLLEWTNNEKGVKDNLNIIQQAIDEGRVPTEEEQLISDYKYDASNKTAVLKTLKEKLVDLYYIIQAGIVRDANEMRNLLINFTEGDLKMVNKKEPPPEPQLVLPPEPAPIEGLAILRDQEKSQWYTNLWHALNGSDTSNTVDPINFDNEIEYLDKIPEDIRSEYRFIVENKTKNTQQTNYDLFDQNLYGSAEWLEFALEHGVVSMVQAKYYNPDENSNKTPNIEADGFEWNSIVYTSAPDIVQQDDNFAIVAAEVKYKKQLKEIEEKDKDLDRDLKKLDTEHNALQTEYESIKEVISKNTERSFKAFS